MYELKKMGAVFTSKFVGTGPSSYEKRIYRAAVSQRLRNTGIVKPLKHGSSPALEGKQACESETRHRQIRSFAHRVYIRQLQR